MPWLSEHEPFEAERSEAQIARILAMLHESPKRVLDLGCGTGRVLIPLANAEHTCTGVDHNAEALAALERWATDEAVSIETIICDFTDAMRMQSIDGALDMVLCLGNTLMTIVDVEQAIAIFMSASMLLADGGTIVIDDIPGEFWPEVTEGYWQNGISDDGAMQMVWAPDDAVFSIRTDDAVDETSLELIPDDRTFRLWTLDALQLLARASGLSAPRVDRECGLIVFRKP